MQNNLREAKNYIKELFDGYENELDIYRAIMYLDNIEDLYKHNPNYAAYYIDYLKNYLKQGLCIADLYNSNKAYIPLDQNNYKNEMKQIANKAALVKIILIKSEFINDKEYHLNFCSEEINESIRYYFSIHKLEKEKPEKIASIKELGGIIKTVFERYKERKNIQKNY